LYAVANIVSHPTMFLKTSKTVDMPTISVDIADYVPALVVVDMQNDFATSSLAGPDTIVPIVNALISLPFKARIATQDVHPGNKMCCAETPEGSEYSAASKHHPEDQEQVQEQGKVRWPVRCLAGTEEADPVSDLKRVKFDAVVHKGTHPNIESYSAFRDVWGKGESELPQVLREVGATDVYFCGLASDYCVKYTTKDAIDRGYNAWVIRDAVGNISPSAFAGDEMLKKGIKFTTFEEIKGRLQSTV